MDPNNNKQANQPTPGPVGNGQSANNQPKPVINVRPIVDNKPAKKSRKTLAILIVSVVVLGLVAAIVLLVLNNKQNDTSGINFEEDNKLDMYSLRAAEVDPTTYDLDEEIIEETDNKAYELLDAEEANPEALRKYFKDAINAELKKNNTDEALKLLWREQDILMRRGFSEDALKALLEMDESKLVKFQKIYLYRAIVTASVMVGDQENLDKYSALVRELDPPVVPDAIEEEENLEEPADVEPAESEDEESEDSEESDEEE